MPIPIWAGRYIGVPFKDHGRDREGLDCWGLVRLVMAEQFDIALPSLAQEYDRVTNVSKVSALIESEAMRWKAVDKGDERLGDIAVMTLRGRPLHVGMVVGDETMLHVESGIDTALERYTGTRWNTRLYGFYRYRPFNQEHYFNS